MKEGDGVGEDRVVGARRPDVFVDAGELAGVGQRALLSRWARGGGKKARAMSGR